MTENKYIILDAATLVDGFMDADGSTIIYGSDVSDGHHTMSELYEHRHTLFAALVKVYDNYITPLGCKVRCWKSKLHQDGTMFDGWFIVGMTYRDVSISANEPIKEIQLSYHLPISWWDRFKIMELERAPEWDGHTSKDVLQRLMKL